MHSYGFDSTRQKTRPKIVVSKLKPQVFAGKNVVLNVYLNPRLSDAQNVKFELINNDDFNIGLLEFDFKTFGNSGRLEFSDIKKGGTFAQLVRAAGVKQPRVKNITIFDDDANERFTKFIVQFVTTQNASSTVASSTRTPQSSN